MHEVWGSNPVLAMRRALVIVDAQHDFIDGADDTIEQGTHGAEIHPRVADALVKVRDTPVYHVHKGCDALVDSYSGFADNAYTKFTDLPRLLYEARVDTVVICGLATDYCVRATAIDATRFGFATEVVTGAIRGVDTTTTKKALADMAAAGCKLV
ncbi:hypothetical protein MCUN1_003425 [Malassezia cuniculi]|uniref:nicotinamidase n=1 Tax=Malassezia cuniculi TaxID=948313 RepID=A0AAF0EXJ4_9BASI|nr:hypothetical protein MCUN1_003425 [Malassezia cuniculi]